MKRSVYMEVVAAVRAQKVWDVEELERELAERFPAEERRSLRAIISQEYKNRAKEAHGKCYRNQPRRRRQVYDEVRREMAKGGPPGALARVARARNYSPSLTAKMVVEEYLRERSGGGRDEVCREDLRSHLRQPAAHFADDPLLGIEVRNANCVDTEYGPVADPLKNTVGTEHENRLKTDLIRMKIAFKDEAKMRKDGFDKTPDIKVVVPFAVGGFVVNWIESKAFFGDEATFAEHIKTQLAPYWNRFGTGMVIYWHGFVDEIRDHKKVQGILVRDRMPAESEVTKFNPFWDVRDYRDEEDEPEEADEAGGEERETVEEVIGRLRGRVERLSLEMKGGASAATVETEEDI